MRIRHLTFCLLSATAVVAGCDVSGRGGGGDDFHWSWDEGESFVLLADYVFGYRLNPAAAGGPTWGSTTVSVAANLGATTPENLAYWEAVSDFCQVGIDIPNFDSVEGVSPILISSSAQQATGTWNGSAYDITGLVAGPAFLASNDTMTVAHQGTALLMETIAAPPALADVNLHLGAPADLATTFGGPDGAFDYLYTLIALDNGATGFDVVSCVFPHDEGSVSNGYRVHPLLDDDAIAWVTSDGTLALGNFGFGAYVNSREIDGFIPDADGFRIVAGRMVQFDPAELAP